MPLFQLERPQACARSAMTGDASGSYVAQQLSQGYVDGYMGVSVTALAVFEFVITLNREVETGWSRRFNLTSVLLISTRWIMVLLQLLAWATSSTKRCPPFQVIIQVLSIISNIQTALFSALRVFALWNRNWSLFTINFVIGITPAICTCFIMTRSRYEYAGPPYNVCSQYVALQARQWKMLIWVPSCATIAGNTMVLALTWVKTIPQVLRLRRLNLAATLMTCILRDGTVYFIILLALNVMQLVTYDITLSEPLSTFGVVLPAILTARFMMNLRRASTHTPGISASSHCPQSRVATHSVRVSTVLFDVPSDLLGNIGEELCHNLEVDDQLVDGMDVECLTLREESDVGCIRSG